MKARDGFSLIEVIIAMMILSVAILAMGASTGYVLAQVRGAELRTDRMMTVRQAAERLRATSWDDLATECGAMSVQQDRYAVTCNYSQATGTLARLQLISEGPGFGEVGTTQADTVVVHIARPVQ